MLLEWHRNSLKIYLELSHQETIIPNSKFIDLQDTFNKSIFEKDQEIITTYIFMYFDDLWEFCNEIMSIMGDIYNLVYTFHSNKINWGITNIEETIIKFNFLNKDKFWDKPLELSEKIKEKIHVQSQKIR